MMKKTVNLNSINRVNAFVNLMLRMPCDAELVSDKYIVNAASVLGVFSLDLSRPVELVLHTDSLPAFLEDELKPYLA